MEEDDNQLSEEMLEAYEEVKNKKALNKIQHNMTIRNRAHGKSKKASEAAEKMEELGIDTDKFK